MPTRVAARRLSFPRLRGAYVNALRGWGRSGSAVRTAHRVLGELGGYLRRRGPRDVRAINEGDIVRFMRTMNGLSPGTRHCYLGVVRHFFGFLVRQRWLLASPAEQLVLPAASPLPRRVPSEADVRKLLRHAGTWPLTAERDRAVLEVLYGSGLRRAECARLDLMDVDLGEGTAWVRNGKGRRDRVVPLTARAIAALAAYLRQNRPVLVKDPRETALFLSEYGGRLVDSSLAKMVRRVAAAAGLDFSAHSLRHACATHLLRRGADVRHIQSLLGHKSLATTSIYTHVTAVDLKAAFARAHPREERGITRQRRQG